MSRPGNSEDGFALIGAVWLLALGSAIVAVLLLRAQADAHSAALDRTRLIERLAIGSAVHTIAAEVLLLGPNSSWSHTPARRTIDIDGTAVDAELTSEEGRLDLNTINPTLLDDVLRRMGVEARTRELLVTTLRDRHTTARPFISLSDAAAFLAPASTVGRCPAEIVTTYAGLSQPRYGQEPRVISELLGRAGTGTDGAVTSLVGVPLRLVVRSKGGETLTAVFRVTASASQPLLINEWIARSLC